MSHRPIPEIQVVKCEDKQSRLELLIVEFLAGLKSDGEASWTLLARSPASPVAKALWRVLAAEHRPLLTIRAIFTQRGPVGEDLAAAASRIGTLSVRHAQDARIADAHEQLVLAADQAWIGDIMRRDPERCDAYECIAAHCEKTARWASISFGRIWPGATPVSLDRLLKDIAPPEATNLNGAEAAGGLGAQLLQVAMRNRTTLTRN